MSNSASNQGGCAGWFKWIVGSFIALLGASGGIAAWVGLSNSSDLPPAPEPIVINVNSGGDESGNGSTVSKQVAVELPPEVFVPTAVPTPMPIPTQENTNRPSEADVKQFLYEAVLAETAAYIYLDPSYISYYFTGELLSFMESEIADLTNNGVIIAKLYDENQSYTYDVRFVNDYKIEVDNCEVWSQEAYSLSNSTLLESDSPALYPQTITIEQFTDGWYITDILFYETAVFCQ
ncbi:MAG: hypothetical protein GY805_07385 [Chloroflexi bacterium]|nr:hypothetical protein [Chloroflexota bacterium]